MLKGFQWNRDSFRDMAVQSFKKIVSDRKSTATNRQLIGSNRGAITGRAGGTTNLYWYQSRDVKIPQPHKFINKTHQVTKSVPPSNKHSTTPYLTFVSRLSYTSHLTTCCISSQKSLRSKHQSINKASLVELCPLARRRRPEDSCTFVGPFARCRT